MRDPKIAQRVAGFIKSKFLPLYFDIIDKLLAYDQADFIKKRLFPLYATFYLRPWAWFRYPTERQLVNGKYVPISEKPSICLFTTHKSASTFLSRLLDDLSSASGMARANFDSYFAFQQVPVPEGFARPDFYDRAYRENGIIYGPHRSYRDIPNLDKYKVILVLRDPRDVLVSYYYSIAFSHPIISKNITEMRKKALSESLDEFVLRKAPEFARKYEEYRRFLYHNPNCLFVKYESMLYESSEFLEEIQSFVDIPLSQEVVCRILEEELTLPQNEDIHRHRRSGRTGDFADKLQPNTVSKLNDLFEDSLDVFGFHKRRPVRFV